MSEIKRCPFCNGGAIYETSREDYLGTVIPQLFCDSCKMIFEVENDSPYLDDKKTEEYLREKLYRQFNTRKPMQEIVERLEEEKGIAFLTLANTGNKIKDIVHDEVMAYLNTAIEIVKEAGGMNG